MARKSIFFTDGDGNPEALEINYWYSLGVNHALIDTLSGTDGWKINRDNTALYERLNKAAFKEQRRMMAGYLKQFRGSKLVKPLVEQFLVNMSEGRAPRLDASGKLCGVSLIVLHYTGAKKKESTLFTFASSILDDGSNLNKGAHFLVDENGKIIQLAPLEQIVMHAKGFNLQSIGIEIAAKDERSITPKQITAAAALCEKIMREHPEIAYVAGHCETMDRQKPYRELFHARPSSDSRYDPEGKPDPGVGVMDLVRAQIRLDIGEGLMPGCKLITIIEQSTAAAQKKNPKIADALLRK